MTQYIRTYCTTSQDIAHTAIQLGNFFLHWQELFLTWIILYFVRVTSLVVDTVCLKGARCWSGCRPSRRRCPTTRGPRGRSGRVFRFFAQTSIIVEKEKPKVCLQMSTSGLAEITSHKLQDERETKVKDAEKRVRDLEDERQRLDDELKKHVERTRRVNIGQEVLEAKMKVN